MFTVQEFTFAINAECLHNNLLENLLIHNRTRAKHAKM